MHPDDYGINRSRNGGALEDDIASLAQAAHRPVTPRVEPVLAQNTKPNPTDDVRAVVVDRLARDFRWLPLRTAVEMADEIINLPDYKAPQTKLELAMLLSEWAFTKGSD